MRIALARFLSLAMAALIAALPVGGARVEAAQPVAVAQAEQGKSSLFRFLFGAKRRQGRASQRAAPPARQRVKKATTRQQAAAPAKSTKKRKTTRARAQSAKKARKQSAGKTAAAAATATASASAAAAAPDDQPLVKADDARRILVVGDFWGRALAEGLTDAYADAPDAVVVDATNGSSGLVRSDLFDWNKALPGLVAEHKPDVIVVMLGANDRQTMETDAGARASEGSEAWSEAYGARVASLAGKLLEADKPVFWAGPVPVRSGAMARDYSAMNSVLREKLEGSRISFVDVWNGFADAEGGFVASGPDMDGQVSRLRTSDGLNFTEAGQRKLAFFLERGLDEALERADGTVVAATISAVPGVAAGNRPAISPMAPLNAPQAGAGESLTTFSETASTGAAAGSGGAVDDIVSQRLGATTPAP